MRMFTRFGQVSLFGGQMFIGNLIKCYFDTIKSRTAVPFTGVYMTTMI